MIFLFFSSKRDIFPTRVFGSVEKLNDLITEPNSVGADDFEAGQEPEKSVRCGSLGAKDLENLRNSRTKACQKTTKIPNRRFRMETTESW